jgi:hypothetical protein
VVCTSAHTGRSLVHTLTGGKYCQKIKFWLRNNSDKPGRSNEASAAANEHSPGLKRHLSPRQLLPHLANQRVQLAHIEIGLSIVLPAQLKEGESVLVGAKATVDCLG